MLNLYIPYRLNTWSRDLNTDVKLGNCLFRAVKLTKNVDPDKSEYGGYCNGFHARSRFSWSDVAGVKY